MLRIVTIVLCLAAPLFAQDELPKSLDDRLKIELFAEHPQLVTPTGIDVDHLGRVVVVESNTHFPPDGYQGHPTDRILILENTDADPQADKVTVFADGLTHTMSLAVEPLWLIPSGGRQSPVAGAEQSKDAQPGGLHPPLKLYVATRNEIFLLRDTDGDLKADEKTRLVHLETKGNYPHNGLAGFAFDALGNMFFGFGENLGANYQIIGSDGTTLTGGGEGGNLYRCKPDGSKLERWATGFWNPHASCFDAFGRLFTVDNDPDSRPPCRLLHVIPGGDYGYRFRNGRKGTHPFTSWNGEIPGTLPMVAGTGEAPSGIVCYENDGFPDDYLGTLLVGSWGDHRIDQFVLEPRGASFTSKAKPIIKGGENFRPVGLTVAPDGSLYFSDWVLKDYKLHGKGRVWRVSGKKNRHRDKLIELGSVAQPMINTSKAVELISSNNMVVRRFAARVLGRQSTHQQLVNTLVDSKMKLRARLEALWALSVAGAPAKVFLEAEFLDAESQHGAYLMEGNEVSVAALCLRRELPLNAVERQTSPIRFGAPLLNREQSPFANQQIADHLRGAWIEQYRPDFMFFDALRPWIMIFESTDDPFVQYHALHSLDSAYEPNAQIRNTLKGLVESAPDRAFSPYFFLHLRHSDRNDLEVARSGLHCVSASIRFAAVQWVGEENLSDLRPDVEAVLADPHTTPDLFLACLATLQLLDGVPAKEFEKNPPTKYIAAMVTDATRPATLRATALRMLPASAPELTAPLLAELLASPDEQLRRETVQTLAVSPLPAARGMLLPIAANSQASVEMRADAVAGLCHGPHEEPLPRDVEALLLKYARGEIDADLSDASQKRSAIETLRLESLRALRGRAVEGSVIRKEIQKACETASEDAALKEAFEILLSGKREAVDPSTTLDSQPGDAANGRRTFFHHQGPLCAKCHTVQGRGGQVGPDLTVIARTMDREKLLSSILEPSKEISPQFTTWVIQTADGKTHTGFILEDNRTGQIKLGTAAGEVLVLNEDDIETREPSKTSVMPEKLHERMTTQELRDLLAFLEALK